MATDWAKDVKKYAANADDAAIAGIVRYCGIALRKVDSSLVAFSDPTELARVRNNFMKKKLGLTHADDVLDTAIAKVGEQMKADRTKNRVTVYYLLAEAHDKLGLFVKQTAEKAAKADKPAKAAAKGKATGAAAAAALAGAAVAGAKKAPAKKADAAAKPAAKATAAKAAAPAKAAPAAKKVTAKAAGVAAAAAGGAAALAAGLGDKAGAAADAAKGAAGDAVDAVKDTATKAGAVVASAAGSAGDLAGKAVGAAGGAAEVAVDAVGAGAAAVAGVAGAAVAGAAGLASGAVGKLGDTAQHLTGGSDEDNSGLGWLWMLLLAALAAFVIWWLFFRGGADDQPTSPAVDASVAAPTDAGAAASGSIDLTAAPAEGSVTIPTGAGVTSEMRDGKPVVKVYFDTGKTEVAPAFGATADGLKSWLDGHAGSSLAISGYNDASGNAAANAKLSKNRAKAVQAALVASGIAEASALLVKPESSTDTSVAKDAARRVEVVVK